MTTRHTALSLALAAATLLGSAALAAEGKPPATLDDGKLHGFTGCLQRLEGDRLFTLGDATTDDGKAIGSIHLTGSISGIVPKESLNQEIHIEGAYRDRVPSKDGGEHLRVSHASVVAPRCS